MAFTGTIEPGPELDEELAPAPAGGGGGCGGPVVGVSSIDWLLLELGPWLDRVRDRDDAGVWCTPPAPGGGGGGCGGGTLISAEAAWLLLPVLRELRPKLDLDREDDGTGGVLAFDLAHGGVDSFGPGASPGPG